MGHGRIGVLGWVEAIAKTQAHGVPRTGTGVLIFCWVPNRSWRAALQVLNFIFEFIPSLPYARQQ
jgi:hypothetical protein